MAVKLSFDNINKTYHSSNGDIHVLKDVCLDIMEGELMCILGTSGCGKSTLLRMSATFENQDSGNILLDGKVVTKPDPKRFMVFQDLNQLFTWKTVLQNIIYPMKVNKIGLDNADRRDIAIKYIEMVGLMEFKDSYPHQLSGGMKQKAALARALALKPQILLMDEPFGSLDAITRAALQKILLDVSAETGVTILFVTHDIHEAIILADRIAIMGKSFGKITNIFENTIKKSKNIDETKHQEIYKYIHGLIEL